MKQVIQNTRSGRLELREVPEPKVRPGHLLVETRASVISAGTERMVLEFAQKSLAAKARARPDLVRKVLDKARRDGIGATVRAVRARLDEPLPLGYSAAGTVAAVGAGLEGAFRVGERVAVAGAGIANHAELNLVPGALAAPVPQSVSDEEAAFGTLAAIALHAVRNTGAGLGDVVAVLGLGLVGQLSSQLLALSGARVVALDYDADRVALAGKTGAELALDLGQGGVEDAVATLTGGRGCDAVLIAAASESSEPFETAARLARDRARVVLVGKTGTAFPYAAFMTKELSVTVSRSYGPGRYDDDFEGRGLKYPVGFVRWTETENLAEAVRLMAPGPPRRLETAALISHRFPLARVGAAYALVTGGAEPHLGVVLDYPGREPAERPAFLAPRTKARDVCRIGVIGAGDFARSVLLPELKALPGVELHTLVARRGARADQAARAFGFRRAGGDEAAVLDNPHINAVVVATRHDSHAELTARALRAGKAVLVEKPLGLSRADINRVVEARRGSDAFFQVGFNRRYAPLSIALRERLAGGPRFLILRVNAGRIAPEHWVHHAEEGGGRILGEVCHFVDLARFLVGAPIVSVHADAARLSAGAADDVTATLHFADGSLATLAYTALGDVAWPKERIEAFAGGRVLTLDDFRSLSLAENGRVETLARGRAPDKGFRAQLRAFTDAVRAGGPAPVDEAELVETSTATLAILESLQSGARVEL